ncbi:MAG TPA: DUF2971 domain-containing protein [Prolixibacteraceae bacterium]|nr:DUF2971 domain-containing protein [Prolixibacteraceae bacterium]
MGKTFQHQLLILIFANKYMIYKYYSPLPRSFEALNSEYFWCSRRQYLNDPFDTHGEIINRFPIFKEEMRRKGVNVDTYATILDRFGICCFSKTELNKHLWSLYADSYKGWVLQFDDEDFEKKLSSQEIGKVTYRDVHYSSEWPNLDDFDTQIPINKDHTAPIRGLIHVIGKSTDSLFEYLLLIKEESIWKIEEEKRIILGRNYSDSHPSKGSTGYQLNWPKGILKSIIIGHNIVSENFDKMKHIARCKNIPLYMTHTVNSELGFELDIKEVDLT